MEGTQIELQYRGHMDHVERSAVKNRVKRLIRIRVERLRQIMKKDGQIFRRHLRQNVYIVCETRLTESGARPGASDCVSNLGFLERRA